MKKLPNNSESHGLPLPKSPRDNPSTSKDNPPPDKSMPPKPRPFDLTEPFQERGVWCFWLTAEPHIQEFISSLNCILGPKFNPSYFRQPGARVMYSLSPRYDHEEAWVWIHDVLQTETSEVELSDALEDALHDAIQSS